MLLVMVVPAQADAAGFGPETALRRPYSVTRQRVVLAA
jgi:hypothetical protein